MEFETQPSNVSPPCGYVTAPTSPSEYTNAEFYYSAPVSPLRPPANPVATNGGLYRHPGSNLKDFEFETSKRFSGHLQFDSSDHFDYYRDPLPSMAFADELFLNGLVMPLKLPEAPVRQRLQHHLQPQVHELLPRTTDIFCKSVIPFAARKSSRNDGFDPFMVALQNVRDDKRGRGAQMRARSYSPFRAMVRCSSDCTYYADQDFSEEDSPVERTEAVKGPSFSGPLDCKGSAYARWVRDQGLSDKSPRRLLLGESVKSVRSTRPGPEKHARPEEGRKYGKNAEESKMQKLKSFLMRYASFGRGSKQSKTRSEKKNKSYSKLGFKTKENVQNNVKRKMVAN